MKVIVAKNIGFCSGVKRAIELSEKSLREDPKPIQFLGAIVHNEEIIKKIKKKGGKFISNPKQAKSGTLIIRTHGTSPFAPVKSLQVRDFTCPLVKKAQKSAQFLSNNGYKLFIIGDKNHPEVKGIKAHTKNKTIVIESDSQAKRLKKFKRIGVVAQTTQNLNKVNRILKILKKKTKELKWLNTICPEVLSRQKEFLQILKKSDYILIIGSRLSANTNRLAEIAEKTKKPVQWINAPKELKKIKLKEPLTVGITSGTSTPNWIVEGVINKLKSI